MILMFVMLLLVSNMAFGRSRIADWVDSAVDSGKDAAYKLNNIDDIYNKNPKMWDFILFTLLFFLISWLGLSFAFKKEGRNIALALAVVIAFALVTDFLFLPRLRSTYL